MILPDLTTLTTQSEKLNLMLDATLDAALQGSCHSDLFLIIKTYKEFKTTFIKHFLGSQKSDVLAPLFNLADEHRRHPQPHTSMEALRKASQVKLKLTDNLANLPWVENVKMNLQKVGNIFGYYTFFYRIHPFTAKQTSEKHLICTYVYTKGLCNSI